ncbi:MAG: universal stress protein [Nitrospirota bacterium]|nr:universal stress protein [Nitrospirota bacterium]
MKILVAYDGTVHAKKALTYGLKKVNGQGGELFVVQVFDPGLFVDYEGGPRAEELARREAALQLNEAKQMVDALGGAAATRIITEEGNAATRIDQIVRDENIDLALAPPRYKKLFGNLACPVMMIPGVMVVPVDNTNAALENIDMIASEALATNSQVILVGIVPEHLYSKEEKDELKKVKSETAASVEFLKKGLTEKRIATSEEIRSGYPDIEILRSAEKHGASLIILPSGGATPSELSKAASILLEEPRQRAQPFVLIHQTGNA